MALLLSGCPSGLVLLFMASCCPSGLVHRSMAIATWIIVLLSLFMDFLDVAFARYPIASCPSDL